MSNSNKITGSLLICFLVFSCNTTHSSADSSLDKAASIYEETMKIKEELAPLLETLIQQRNGLSVQGRSLTKEEQRFIDGVYAVEDNYMNWEKKQVDVSGRPIDGQGPTLQLSPSKMFLLQKEQQDALLAIKEKMMEWSRTQQN